VKDTVADDLVLVARIEALIAGYEMDEALLRAYAYADAGADAILIHSRRSTADEILSFARAWQNRLPVVIVPTKYYRTPISVYREARIATVIWANHSMRAAIAALRQVCRRITAEENTASVEPNIATLDEVFELLKYANSPVRKRYICGPTLNCANRVSSTQEHIRCRDLTVLDFLLAGQVRLQSQTAFVAPRCP